MGLYILIGDSQEDSDRHPILVTKDLEIVAATARAVARRLGADSAVVRRLNAIRRDSPALSNPRGERL